MKRFICALVLVINSTSYATGWETGGGHPTAVGFRLLGISTLKQVQKCAAAEKLLEPKSATELLTIVRKTKLRMSKDPLIVDGGVVLAKPERNTESGELGIAVDVDEFQKFLDQQSQSFNWRVTNLHEYMRVGGLGVSDDIYDVSTRIIELLNECTTTVSPLSYQKITLVYPVTETIIKLQKWEERTENHYKDCNGTQQQELDGKMGRYMKRAGFSWLKANRDRIKDQIQSQLDDAELLNTEFDLKQPNNTYVHVPDFIPGNWDDLRCLGMLGYMSAEATSYISLEDDSSILQRNTEQVAFYPHTIATRHITDSEYYDQINEHFVRNLKRVSDACVEWRNELRSSFGDSLSVSSCYPSIKLEKGYVGHQLMQFNITANGIYYLKEF